VTETTPTRRFGFKRWIVLALILLGIYLGFIAGGIFKPVSPAVVLPAEKLWPTLGEIQFLGQSFTLTNTLLATFLADLVLLWLGWRTVAFMRSGKQVPAGVYHIVEMIIEFLWNTAQGTAGKWAKRMFPVMATIFLLVLVANLIRIVPGFETIGYLAPAEGTSKGYTPVQIAPGIYALDGSSNPTAAAGQAGTGLCTACTVVPFLRGSATDLNFTFALAIVAVLAVEYFGFRALGLGYLGKFFNFGGMINKPVFGVIDAGVGLLELVSEISKIISFAFRLFGNIFAGTLLLSILGALTVAVIPSFLYVLELFVGAVQAYVFGMLTLVFMSQAVVGHGGDHDEHAEAPAH
jgi:F-type H+-transporting ATPase subunit a